MLTSPDSVPSYLYFKPYRHHLRGELNCGAWDCHSLPSIPFPTHLGAAVTTPDGGVDTAKHRALRLRKSALQVGAGPAPCGTPGRPLLCLSPASGVLAGVGSPGIPLSAWAGTWLPSLGVCLFPWRFFPGETGQIGLSPSSPHCSMTSPSMLFFFQGDILLQPGVPR